MPSTIVPTEGDGEHGDRNGHAAYVVASEGNGGPLAPTSKSFKKVASMKWSRSDTSDVRRRKGVAIAIADFPLVAQEILREFDDDNDGTLDIQELAKAAQLYRQSQRAQRRMFWLSLAILALMVLFCGALSGIVYAVVKLTRQMDINNNGLLMVKGTDQPVSVMSNTKFTPIAWSSSLDSGTVLSLRYIEIAPSHLPENRLVLFVNAASILPDPASGPRSFKVVFYTNSGTIMLSGDGYMPDVEVDDSLATFKAFTAAGFDMSDGSAAGRRRLAGTTTTTTLWGTGGAPPPAPSPPPPRPPPPIGNVCTGSGCTGGSGGSDTGGVGRRLLRSLYRGREEE